MFPTGLSSMLAHRRSSASWAVPFLTGGLALLLLLPSGVPAHSVGVRAVGVVVHEGTAAAPLSLSAAPAGATAPGPGAVVASSWSAKVVRTLFPNYNGSIGGNFRSSVLNLKVGAPAYLPSAQQLWWPELPHAGNGSAAPPTGPTVLYNLTDHAVQGVDASVANASALLYDADVGRLYAAEPLAGSVRVLDPTNGSSVGAPIPVGQDPRALGYDPATHELFVANAGSNNVTVIDTHTDKVVDPGLAVGLQPLALVVDPADGLVYVANGNSSNLTVLRTDDLTGVHGYVGLSDGPAVALAYAASAGVVAAVEPSSRYLTVVEAATTAVVNPLAMVVGTGATAIAVDGSGSYFVVANSSGSTVLSLATNKPFVGTASAIAVGPNPSVVATDPLTGGVLVWSRGDRTFSEVDPAHNAVLGHTTPLLSGPTALAYDRSAARLFVADANLPGIEVLDPYTGRSVAAPIVLAAAPTALLLDPTHGILYAALPGEVDALYASNGTELASNRLLPGANGPMVLDANSSLIWVGRPGAGNYLALSPTTLAMVRTTPGSVGVNAAALASLALDPATNELFAVDFSLGTVRSFNGTTGAWTGPALSVGANVTALAFDPADGLLYAAGDSLAALDPQDASVEVRGVPLAPHVAVSSLTYDPVHTKLLVRSVDAEGYASLSVVDGSSPAAANSSLLVVPTGLGAGASLVLPMPPGALAGAGAAVSANAGSGTISVVTAPPSLVSFAFAPSTVDLNGTTTALVLATGGAGPVGIDYAGLPPGCASSSTLTLACTPTEQGSYSVTVTLTDPLGETTEATGPVHVGPSLAAAISVGTTASGQVDVGVPVTCRAVVSAGVPPYSARWSFGDGTGAEGLSANHTFGAVGLTTATLTATDAGGGSVSVSEVVEVVALPSVVLSANAAGLVTDVNLSVGFQATVTGGTTPGSGSWTFGDNGPSVTGLSAEHAFARPGLYPVRFSYTDASGVGTGAALNLLVHAALAATFDARPADAAGSFGFLASVDGGTAPYTVLWSFGDGSEGSGLSPRHGYAAAGGYVVNVTVTDAAGAVVSSSLRVTVGSPSSAASWLPGGSTTGLVVGLMVGTSVAAVVLFLAERSIHRRRFRPPRPYVPPPGSGPS